MTCSTSGELETASQIFFQVAVHFNPVHLWSETPIGCLSTLG